MVEDGGQHDQRRDEHVEIKARRAQKKQHVGDGVDEEHAQEDADDRASAAAQRQPADDAGGDRLKLQSGALPRLHAADAGRCNDARNRRHAAGDREGHQLDAVGVDADRFRSTAIAAGGEHMVAEAVMVDEVVETDDEEHDPDEGGVDAEQRA